MLTIFSCHWFFNIKKALITFISQIKYFIKFYAFFSLNLMPPLRLKIFNRNNLIHAFWILKGDLHVWVHFKNVKMHYCELYLLHTIYWPLNCQQAVNSLGYQCCGLATYKLSSYAEYVCTLYLSCKMNISENIWI